ncbi:Ig-like domain-containing protein [Muricauda sp. MAR_2010_75]|uniref:Ig-like domain-containing protein n=1 Tax=Allomuricauda sp. MAR_2010_75 TaxID=1250232 RepID=UPI000569AC4A|nr:Ig-like domain-containing protein [Muricauda sp. MAR_2010_75]
MSPIFLLLLTLISACSSDSNSTDDSPDNTPVLSSISIGSSNGNQLDLFGTNTTSLSVMGTDQFGLDIAITETVTWSANNDNVSVDQNGMVTGQKVGNSTVEAAVGSLSKTIALTIVDSEPQPGTYIYVSDAVNFNNGPWKIFRYDENGQNPTVFIDEELAWPQDIVFLEDQGQVLISNLSSGKINRHDAATGALIGSFATNIGGPTRMKIGADNLLYVLQWQGDGLVLRYGLDGTLIDKFTSVAVPQSIGLDWDSEGNLYVSSYSGAFVQKFDSEGNDLGKFIASDVEGPTNIWFDENDNLFANDWTGNKVVQFDSEGNFVKNVISTGINQPEGVDFFPNGDFLIGSGGTSEVRQYDSNGNFIKNLVSAGAGGLVRPNAVRIRVIE